MQDKQYVIKPCFFDVKIELLKKSIKDVVVDTFNLDPTSPISDRMVTHVSMLNRYSFSKRLRELLKGIYLDVEYKETRRFIDIRDRLVHDARFLKQGEGQNTESNIEQYHRVLTFIGRMMLGLLEYDGHYHDWTKYTPGEWAGPEAKQRVMMVYSKKKGR